jgi:hypothetical protein
MNYYQENLGWRDDCLLICHDFTGVMAEDLRVDAALGQNSG